MMPGNNYRQRKALKFIEKALRCFGHVNATNVQLWFDMSHAQAAKDIRTFQRLNPKAMVYDKANKWFVPAEIREDGRAFVARHELGHVALTPRPRSDD